MTPRDQLEPEIRQRLDAWWDHAGELSRLTTRVKKRDFEAIVAHVANDAIVGPPRGRKPTKQLEDLSRDISKMIGHILDLSFLDPDFNREIPIRDRIEWLADFRDAIDRFASSPRRPASGGGQPSRLFRRQKEIAIADVYQLLSRPNVDITPTLDPDGPFVMLSTAAVDTVTGTMPTAASMIKICSELLDYWEVSRRRRRPRRR
jgi:hypothetical protein